MTWARVIADLLAGYAIAGLLFGCAFAAAGVQRVDKLAAGTGPGFRLLILPGAAALWPLLLRRWLSHARRSE